MKKRRFIVTALVCVCVLTGFLGVWRYSQDCSYQDVTVKDWSLKSYQGDEQAAVALKEMGPKAIPDLIRLLQARNSYWRRGLWAAAPSLPSQMQRIIRSKLPLAALSLPKEAAARSLGIIGPEARPAVPALVSALSDKEWRVEVEAATALGRIGPGSVPDLIQALRDKDLVVRQWAATALAQIGREAEAAVPSLIECLDDKNEQVRTAAAYSLSKIGTPALPALMKASHSGRNNAREAACRALDRIYPSPQQAVPELVMMAKDQDPGKRLLAIETLGVIRPANPLAVKTLVEAMGDPDSEVRLAAIKASGQRKLER